MAKKKNGLRREAWIKEGALGMWAPRGVPRPGCYRGRGGGSLGLPSSPPGYSLPPIDPFPVVHFRTPLLGGRRGHVCGAVDASFVPIPVFLSALT